MPALNFRLRSADPLLSRTLFYHTAITTRAFIEQARLVRNGKILGSFLFASFWIKPSELNNISTALVVTSIPSTHVFKDGAYYCYCAYVLRIARYSGFLWVVPTNTGIFLRSLKLYGESRTYQMLLVSQNKNKNKKIGGNHAFFSDN